jgi:hypothetical protein
VSKTLLELHQGQDWHFACVHCNARTTVTLDEAHGTRGLVKAIAKLKEQGWRFHPGIGPECHTCTAPIPGGSE